MPVLIFAVPSRETRDSRHSTVSPSFLVPFDSRKRRPRILSHTFVALRSWPIFSDILLRSRAVFFPFDSFVFLTFLFVFLSFLVFYCSLIFIWLFTFSFFFLLLGCFILIPRGWDSQPTFPFQKFRAPASSRAGASIRGRTPRVLEGHARPRQESECGEDLRLGDKYRVPGRF